MNRIKPLDGLRTLAVVGVVWAHVWMFMGNPAFKIGMLDINKAISVVGTGVDLFFVISGFCMYLMYTRKNISFSWNGFWIFIKKRWARIAPAFYAAVIIFSIIVYFEQKQFSLFSILVHFAFLHTLIPVQELAAPFWSLATEWHFYLTLPVFFYFSYKLGFIRTISVFMLLSFAYRIWLFYTYGTKGLDLSQNYQLFGRYVEFGFGIIACKWYLSERKLPYVLRGWAGFILSFAIAYAGRLMMSTEVVSHFGKYDFICLSLSAPVLTIGYACMTLNVITEKSFFQTLFMKGLVQQIGKISYSMYLWHWPLCYWVANLVARISGTSVFSQHVSFCIVMLLLYPISCISYKYLEAPYFQKTEKKLVLQEI